MDFKLKLLLLEDNEGDAMLEIAMFRSAGYTIDYKIVDNREDFIYEINNDSWDCLICDFSLPTFNGHDALIEYKKCSLDAPFIILSGLIGEENAVRLLTNGANDVIMKDKMKQLIPAVERELRKTALRREHTKSQLALIESEKKLKELNASKDKLFSIIAHDLRSPFASLLGLIEMINTDLDTFTAEEIQEFFESLSISANNVYKLLENLLKWAQVQNGSIQNEPQSYFIKEIMKENFDTIRDIGENKGIKIQLEIEHSKKILVDKTIFCTIIRNLVSNAIKFTFENGIINIFVEPVDDKFLRINVKDSGTGMPENILQKLFVVGEKVGTLGTNNEPSTGLGLILVKDFVKMLGGEIKVESEINKGSLFSFTVPYA